MALIDRTKGPEIYPIADMQLPQIRRYALRNGVPVYILDNENLELIHFIFSLKVGIFDEDQKHVSTFTYSLLKQSSREYSSTEIADLLAFYGVHYTVSEMLNATNITISVPRNNVTKILPVIYDFLTNPLFKEENLETYKNLKIKDLEYNVKKPDVRNTQLLVHAMFGDKYTAGQFSSRDNINAVTVEGMQRFHQRTFCAENLSVFVTGNVDDAVEDCFTQLFSQVQNGKPTAKHENIAMPADRSSIICEEIPGSVQSSISLCSPSMGFLDPERMDFSILTTITGGYFGSRLMQNLREKNGYTYGVSAGSVYFGNQSLFIINSDVNIADTKAAIDACFYELKRLQTELVDEEELETVRNYLIGESLRGVENAVSYLKKFQYWRQYGLDEQEFRMKLQRIRNITAEEIQALAKKHFDYNNFTQIIVGGSL